MQRYLRLFFITWGAALVTVAFIARLIDPYGYWGAPIWDGVNRWKPATNRHIVPVKLAQVERVQPRLIVAGNSRVAVGFDPKSPNWPAASRPVYNLGLPGKFAEQVADATIAALDRTRPTEVVLGVDIVDFRIWRHRWSGVRPWRAPEQLPLAARMTMLLSLDALADSARTVAEQRKAWPMTVEPDGFNPLLDYNGVVAEAGHAAIFAKRVADNAAKYRAGPKAVAWPGPGTSRAWDSLDRIADACAKRGIRLTVVTYPYHVTLLRVFEDTGLWPAFEDWQRRLAGWGVKRNVTVWDFSRVTPETAEPVPPPGDTATQMRWYWEGGHFKSALGEEMIRELAGASPPRLGVKITPANVEAVIADTRTRVASAPPLR